MNDFDNIKQVIKIPTGIEGFEHLTMGGLPEGRTALLGGTSGSGKTIFAIEFLYRGATQFDRPGVFVTFEERPHDIIRNVMRLNWDLVDLIKQKKFMFVDASPEPVASEEVGQYDLGGLMAQIHYAVKSVNAKLLVLDSIGSLFHQFRDTSLIWREIFRITEEFKKMGLKLL